MSVTERVDESVRKAAEADQAFDAGDFEVSAQLYWESSQILRDLLRSNLVKEERSKEFLASQCDKFKRLAKTAERKAAKAQEKSLNSRLRGLQGLPSKPPPKEHLDKEEEELRKRLEALKQQPGLSEEELESRLEALGPSQFPKVEEQEEDPRVVAALKQAMLESTRESGEDEEDGQLAALLERMEGQRLADLGGDDAEVAQIIRQAKDYARVSNPGTKPSSSLSHSSSSDSSDSSSSDSSEDSDDSLAHRKNKKNQRKNKKKSSFSFFRR